MPFGPLCVVESAHPIPNLEVEIDVVLCNVMKSGFLQRTWPWASIGKGESNDSLQVRILELRTGEDSFQCPPRVHMRLGNHGEVGEDQRVFKSYDEGGGLHFTFVHDDKPRAEVLNEIESVEAEIRSRTLRGDEGVQSFLFLPVPGGFADMKCTTPRPDDDGNGHNGAGNTLNRHALENGAVRI